jgi:signal transduction histidine kinase
MLRLLFIVCLTCLPLIGQTQSKPSKLDSLRMALYASRQDTSRAAAMNALANYYRNHLPDSALFYAQQAQELSEKKGWLPGVAFALMLQGVVNRILGNYPLAMEQSQRAIQTYEKLSHYGGLGQTYNNLGLIYLKKEELDEAAAFFLNGIGYAQRAGNQESVSVMLNNLGLVAQNRQRYDSAIYFYRKSYKISLARHDSVVMANNLRNIGNSHRLAGRVDSALYYLPLARRIYQHTNNPISESVATLAIARLYFQQGQLEQSQRLADSVLAVVVKLRAKEPARDAYQLTYEIQKRAGNVMAALQAFERAIAYKDSLFNEEKVKQLNNLQANFDLERAKRQNEILTQQKADDQFMMAIGWASLATLLLILGILWRNVTLKKRALRQLESKNKYIEDQNQELALQQEAIAATNQELRLRYEELTKFHHEQEGLIGIVAHDLRSPLAQVRGLMQLLQLGGPLTEDQQQCLKIMDQATEGGMALIRDILYVSELETKQGQLHPETLAIHAWLGHFLGHYMPVAQKKGIQLLGQPIGSAFDLVTDQSYLRRILDNLVSNALKFSPLRAQVTVKWWAEAGRAYFSVRDQGPGLSDEDKARLFKKFQKLSARPTGDEDSTGLGLAIAKVLAERIGGQIEAISQVGHGAEFILSLPLA